MAAPTSTVISKVPLGYLRLLPVVRAQPVQHPALQGCSFHTCSILHKDRRKDKAVSQYLYYRDHEKTMRHRNLPLLDLPDYSYTDGRPTEVSICQSQRQEKNYQLAKRVVELVEEMKQAEDLHQQQQAAEANRQRQRLESRLKTKQTEFKG